MSTTCRLRVLALTAAGVIGAFAAAPAADAAAATAPASTVKQVPISFQVRNVNRSAFACASDGRTYTVRGHLVGPAAQLARPPKVAGVTLYLHGLDVGEFFWRDTDAPGRNYAVRQAQAGLTSVVIDRLGYGASGKPDGNAICAGSRADIAHQMVLALRSGSYTVAKQRHIHFSRVALAGHSYGGQIAELEAYSFGGIDALSVISYTDQGQSALAAASSAYSAKACAAGGQRVVPGGPGHYAPYGNPRGAKAALFNDIDPLQLATAVPRLTLNPCGDMLPFAAVAALNLTRIAAIKVPVLVVSGGADALFPPLAGRRQAALFTGSSQVDLVTLPRTAHGVTFERTLGFFTPAVHDWLLRTPVA